MGTMGKRLRFLRERIEKTQGEVAKDLGVARSTLGYYEIDKRDPDSDTIRELANYYHVSTDYLLGESNNPTPSNILEIGELVRIPVIGVIRAGEPVLAEQNITGWEWVERIKVQRGEYFYLRVTGDSMVNARIHEGDLVLVRRQEDVDDGQIAVVLLEDEATLKRVFKQNGQLILQAENPKYPPRVIKKGNVKILGIVIEGKYRIS